MASTPSERAEAPAESVGRSLARGSLWVAASQGLAAVCRLAVSVTAARLLVPADFGLMGLAALVVATLQALSETGVERAFVQRRDATGYADVAWTLLFGRSLLLSLLLAALATPLAWFYDEPRLLPILGLMSLAVAATGLRNVSAALLNRELQFGKLFTIEAARALTHLLVGLSLVLILRSVWALVLSHVVTALVEVVISYVIHPHRPRFELDRAKVIELLRFGRWVSGMTVLALLVTRGDDMFISKYLGAEAFGLYVLAYEIANIPATQITHVLGRVSFPAYARLHAESDPAPLRAAFSRVARSTLLLSGSATVIIAFCIDGLVEHVLGPQWRPAIALVRILVIAGFVRSLAGLAGALFHAVGRPDLDFRMNAPRLALLVILIWPACLYAGLAGASVLVLLSVASCLPTWFYGVRLFTGLTVRELARENAPAFVVAVVLALSFVATRSLLSGATALGAIAQLLSALALTALALLALERTTSLRVLTDLRAIRGALRQR